MLSYLFDLLFVLLFLGVSIFVAKRWSTVHCAAVFVSVLIASLLAITTFEPIAVSIATRYLTFSERTIAVNLFFVIGTIVFLVSLAILLRCIHAILPTAPTLSPRGETFGRWGFGALTGYLFASFILCVVSTLPAPANFGGLFEPTTDRRPGPVMALAPDYQFLAFVEYTCDDTFALTGRWLLDRPIFPPVSYRGRWGSFPMRYELWRQGFTYNIEDEFNLDEELLLEEIRGEENTDDDTTTDVNTEDVNTDDVSAGDVSTGGENRKND